MNIEVKKTKALKGAVEIPADKSITQRAFLFSALSKGRCRITNFSKGADCMAALNIIERLGCKIEHINEKELIIDASAALKAPEIPLDCRNSGTAARIVSGILASQNFDSELSGDESLSKRPMKRIITPLELMGAEIIHNDFKLPIKIKGGHLKGIDYISPIASAQVKSCVLAAGLNAEGITSFTEPCKSRNHTELMFKFMGADIKEDGNKIIIKNSMLHPADITVCGDISSAAFFITAALIVPNSDITIKNTGINETRSGILDVYKKMGADIEILNERTVSGEKTADLRVKYSKLKGTVIEGSIIPRLIDEIPAIAAAAALAEGGTVIKDAQDLRNKESDRINAMALGLSSLGADIQETADGLIIQGKKELEGGCKCSSFHDHRIAMSLYTAGLACKKPIQINEFEWVNISFPEFLELFSKITAWAS